MMARLLSIAVVCSATCGPSSDGALAKDDTPVQKLLDGTQRHRDLSDQRESLTRAIEDLRRSIERTERKLEELRRERESLELQGERRPQVPSQSTPQEFPRAGKGDDYQFQSPGLDLPLESSQPSDIEIEA